MVQRFVNSDNSDQQRKEIISAFKTILQTPLHSSNAELYILLTPFHYNLWLYMSNFIELCRESIITRTISLK
jgi:hypothetical protein